MPACRVRIDSPAPLALRMASEASEKWHRAQTHQTEHEECQEKFEVTGIRSRAQVIPRDVYLFGGVLARWRETLQVQDSITDSVPGSHTVWISSSPRLPHDGAAEVLQMATSLLCPLGWHWRCLPCPTHPGKIA